MEQALVDRLIQEAKRIEEDCILSSKGHFAASHNLTQLYYWLGVPASILSAIAGGSALSSFSYHGLISAVLSLVVLALTAATTFLNPGKKAAVHLEAGNEYGSLRSDVRIFYGIDVTSEVEKTLPDKLKALSDKRNEYNKKYPQIPPRAFRAAQRGVAEGHAKYEVDNLDDVGI